MLKTIIASRFEQSKYFGNIFTTKTHTLRPENLFALQYGASVTISLLVCLRESIEKLPIQF